LFCLVQEQKNQVSGSDRISGTHNLRLAWQIDEQAHAELEGEIFGKHVLVTSHDDWPVAEVVAGYRSQSEAESGFRQLKDRRVVSFSPMHHWTDHNVRVHMFTCVLALQLAHLMRYRARQHGLRLSVRDLLSQLAGIQETVLIYPSTGGRPKGPPHDHRARRQPAAPPRDLRLDTLGTQELGHDPGG